MCWSCRARKRIGQRVEAKPAFPPRLPRHPAAAPRCNERAARCLWQGRLTTGRKTRRLNRDVSARKLTNYRLVLLLTFGELAASVIPCFDLVIGDTFMSTVKLRLGSSPRTGKISAVQQRFSTLDGLRGIAALAVLQYHVYELFGFQFQSSYLAVDLFFVLSGLVLARAYEQKIRKGMSAGQFMLARIIRLYPLYIAGTIVGVSFVFASSFLGVSDNSFLYLGFAILLAIFFLPTPPGILAENLDLFPFNYPAWSLFFELVANLFFAMTVPVLTTRVLISLVGVGAILVIWSALQFGGLNSGFNWNNFSGGLGRVIFSFFFGVLLYRYPLNWQGSGRHTGLCIAVLISIFCMPVSESYRLVFDLLVVFFVFPVLAALSAASEGGYRTRQCFFLLGNLSYAIYAVHAPLAWWAMGISSKVAGVQLTQLAPASGICFAVAICVIGWTLDRYYDSPVRRILAR